MLCPPDTTGSVDVRGGAPGTRETDAIRPGRVVNELHAVLLTGGGAFGLAAASGVQRWLEERGIGFDTGVARVPIVPAAVNALGTVLGEDGEPIAENRNPDADPRPWPGTNTTLEVATNARLTKDRAQLLAQAGSESVSTVVSPAHTMWDGDTGFAVATGEVEGPQRDLEAMAGQAVAEAIRRGSVRPCRSQGLRPWTSRGETRHEDARGGGARRVDV